MAPNTWEFGRRRYRVLRLQSHICPACLSGSRRAYGADWSTPVRRDFGLFSPDAGHMGREAVQVHRLLEVSSGLSVTSVGVYRRVPGSCLSPWGHEAHQLSDGLRSWVTGRRGRGTIAVHPVRLSVDSLADRSDGTSKMIRGSLQTSKRFRNTA